MTFGRLLASCGLRTTIDSNRALGLIMVLTFTLAASVLSSGGQDGARPYSGPSGATPRGVIDAEEKREPVSHIAPELVDSLKVLDPNGRLEKRTNSSDGSLSPLCADIVAKVFLHR